MKFYIETLGCKVNNYESNYMSEALINNGFLLINQVSEANVIIVNTCTVTNTADSKSLKFVKRLKRENPNALMVVAGCSVQNNSEKYENLSIDILIGNKDKSKIVELINETLESKKSYQKIYKTRALPFEDMTLNKFNHTRAFIKIQDGCDNFCSYCIIPFVRGSIRSKDFDKIIAESNELVKNGHQELVLTGIHTGSYSYLGKDLTDVINNMSEIEGLKRIRLSSVEITELDDKFLDMLKKNVKFCDHLHIPLQAGSDEILEAMNRKYNLNYFYDQIEKIRKIRPDISITTDIIVGFPGETEENFNNTLKNARELKFSKIHVFPYSDRSGTKASRMSNKISEVEKKRRVHELIKLSDELEKEYYNKFKGKELDVLIEEVKDNKSMGHTSNYLLVEVDEELEKNRFYKCIL